MDPVFKSWLTSTLVGAAGAGVTWAVSVGIVPEADKNAIANAIAGLGVFLIGLLIAWYKARQASPPGLIKSIGASDPTAMKNALQSSAPSDQSAVLTAVNKAENGLKIVPAASAPGIPAVNVPLKEAAK